MKKELERLRAALVHRTRKTKSDCWEWTGPKFGDGYGNCGSGFPFQRAHRTSYLLHNGEITQGLYVLHKCDNPLCINPNHLYLGDAKQNAKDAIERGQHPVGPNKKKGHVGEKNLKAKLSEKDVLDIRKRYIPRKVSTYMLAKEYGVHRKTIQRLINKENWSHI